MIRATAGDLITVQVTNDLPSSTSVHWYAPRAGLHSMPPSGPNRLLETVLEGRKNPHHWTIDGRTHPDTESLPVSSAERVRVRIMNRTMMFHPWRGHGHTFAPTQDGAAPGHRRPPAPRRW